MVYAMSLSLTLDLANTLDIQVSQMTGLLQDPRYEQIVQEYELDTNQCQLWWEISQILSEILANHEYDDLELSHFKFGLEIKRVLAAHPDKYSYVKQLLEQYGILHHNAYIGKVIIETMEDIQMIYNSIAKELQKLMASQTEIQDIVDGTDNTEEDQN